MKDIDICMLSTTTAHGAFASRPMSNNGEVEYDGNSYIFTWKGSRASKDIEKNNHVNLGFQGKNDIRSRSEDIKSKNAIGMADIVAREFIPWKFG